MVVIGISALAYFVAGKFGLQLASVHPSATAVWPPSGIALATFILFGAWALPGIFLGAFLVNLTTAGSAATSLGIAVGNTLEGLIGAALVIRFANGRRAFDRPQDVFKFILLAAVLSTTVSPTFGATSLALGGFADWSSYPSIWFTWWLGDVAGDLIVAPLLLLWAEIPRPPLDRRRIAEAGVVLLMLTLVGVLVFGGPLAATKKYPLEFLCIPLVVWAAYRFNQRLAATATVILSAITVWATVSGLGPFARYSPNESLLLLQTFVGVVGVAALVLAASVSERRRAEAQLAAAKDRLAVTLGSIGEGVIVTDPDGNVVTLNSAAERLTGWTQTDAQGRPLQEVFRLVHAQTNASLESPVERVRRSGAIVSLVPQALLVARDGTQLPIADSSAPIRGADGELTGVVLTFQDVSDRLRMENELARASKLESLGVLAGGIAHDFNNLLTAILANISLSRMPAMAAERTARWLSEAERAALRAKELTQQLLTFARGGVPVLQSVALPSLVEEACRFAVAGSNIECDVQLPKDIWPVQADGGQISQVLHNLVLNARQAMPSGGRVVVRAENVPWQGGHLPLAEGDYVRIAVEDRGSGIPSEHMPRIFDPFFTTKAAGTGLGLSTAHSIVQRHGGHITAESSPGSGTIFWVYLPATHSVPASRPGTQPGTRGRGRVLVMDDEAIVRETASSVLGELGYQVSTAPDGQTVVDVYRLARAAGRPFDVVILDLTVPNGMGGLEALEHLRELDPHVITIVSSGYSNDAVMADYLRYGFRGVIGKPYTAPELGDAVQRALQRQPQIA